MVKSDESLRDHAIVRRIDAIERYDGSANSRCDGRWGRSVDLGVPGPDGRTAVYHAIKEAIR